MNVIGDATYLKWLAIQTTHGCRKIGMYFRPEIRRLQKSAAIFGGKDDVYENESQ